MDPLEIKGNGVLGYTLDVHTISSVYLGVDELGHDRFNTTRSDLGELMYRLKYCRDEEACEEIMDIISSRTQIWMAKLNITGIIAMPPTDTSRLYQPVDYLANELSKITGIYYYKNYLVKTSSGELKSASENVQVSIDRIGELDSKRNVLLIDDLYKTGRTMRAACTAIRTDSNVDEIYTLAITRTRR